jgi:imidazolonepropionase-like amidohydrolase
MDSQSPAAPGFARMTHQCRLGLWGLSIATIVLNSTTGLSQVAVHGEMVYTMAGEPIKNGTVIIQDGKIAAIGRTHQLEVPEGMTELRAKVVTPGLVDAHCTVGLAGILNSDHDQDQLESSEPIQPELRALDAYNAHEELISWVRSFGVTTIHTGHAPGELISGQTLIAKTSGNTVESAVVVEARAVVASLHARAQKSGTESPGTRGKMVAMLRAELIRAQEYLAQQAAAESKDTTESPERKLRLEVMGQVLQGRLPLLVTAHRAQDIANALRLANEFKFQLWLDGGAEAYLLIDEIKAAGIPVIVHPTMARPTGELENASFETAGILAAAGITVVFQSGYESYVPKTRVVLFEAALAAAHGLPWEKALAAITIDAARVLGIDDRVGSLAIGKDGDVALYDGDPFEYTSHCVGVVIGGEVVSREAR